MIKLGVAEWCLDVQAVQAFDRAAEAGLSAMHVSGGPDLFSDPDLQRGYVEASRRTGVRMTMLSLNCLLRSGGITGVADQEERGRCGALFQQAIDAAVRMGIGIVYLPSFVEAEIKTDQDLMHTANLLKDACRYAADKPILIASENSLGVAEIDRLFELVDESNFRLFFDTLNPVLWGHSPVEIINRFAGRMCDQVHVKDGVDGQMGNAPLFQGEGRLTETLEALARNRFSGDLVLENYYHTDMATRLQQDMQALRRQSPFS